jgi:hypothetical protein
MPLSGLYEKSGLPSTPRFTMTHRGSSGMSILLQFCATSLPTETLVEP